MYKRFIYTLFLLFSFIVPLLYASGSEAAPLGFRRPRATFAFGLDAFNTFTGDFAKYTDVGMKAFVETSLQAGGYFGFNLRFGSARGFTHKDFLPFDNGYQFIFITASPRFYLAPFRKTHLYFYAQPDINVNIFMSNTLVKITGNDSVTWAAGGAVGAQYIIGVFSFSGQVSCQYDWELKTLFISGGLAVGFASTIR